MKWNVKNLGVMGFSSIRNVDRKKATQISHFCSAILSVGRLEFQCLANAASNITIAIYF